MPTRRTPRSMSAWAPPPVRETKSSTNESCSQSVELRVLKRTRSASSSCASASPSSRSVTPVASTTRTGPTSTWRGSVSAAAAPSMKCAGASTCVPVWTPKSSRLTFAAAPSASALTRSSWTVGSPGYVTIPGRIATLMSRISTSFRPGTRRLRYAAVTRRCRDGTVQYRHGDRDDQHPRRQHLPRRRFARRHRCVPRPAAWLLLSRHAFSLVLATDGERCAVECPVDGRDAVLRLDALSRAANGDGERQPDRLDPPEQDDRRRLPRGRDGTQPRREAAPGRTAA